MVSAPRLNTARKMQIASVLSRVILGLRTLSGGGPLVRVRRDGITWCLDLREGIDLAIFLKVYERSSVKELDRLVPRGSVVLDIGANLGFYSLLLADRVGPDGRVVAFEPTDFAYAKLNENLAANPALATRVTARRAILVAGPGEVAPTSIVSNWPLNGSEPVDPSSRGVSCQSRARSVTLDDALAPLEPGVWISSKLDVDGHETAVLLGGRATIERFHPDHSRRDRAGSARRSRARTRLP
jgi:FkbM family methyltransferase